MGATNISGIGQKEAAVWKLLEALDRCRLRHWIQAVDSQLEVIHKFKCAGQVLDQIKRSKVEVTPKVLETSVETANFAHEGVGGSPGIDIATDWEYKDKSLLLYAYFINTLNVFLYDKTVGIADKNGFELYWQICQLVDAVPENAIFHTGAGLSAMVQKFGGKINDLKNLYVVRLLLKKKSAEYRKILGVKPDSTQLINIM